MSVVNLTFEQLPTAVAQLFEKLSNIEKLLSKPEPQAIPDRLDFNGALSFLNAHGYRISKSKLQKETANGTIPCSRFNKRLLFVGSELLNWAQSRVKPHHDHAGIVSMLAKSAKRKYRKH